ncbi:MAG: AhpC/TSA family protein [Bacteroidaceae bacterium]|nr:AhpC/TSA family protein [Bacteroidaceae bacterium]
MNILRAKTLFCIVSAILLLTFSSCNNKPANPSFSVTGKIDNGAGKTLYLSNIGIKGNILLDSIVIGKDGSYTFCQPQPASYDFFFIAINGERPIVFAIDSTETVTINSDANNFYDAYTVEGNDESLQIKEMNELQAALEKQVNEMLKSTSPAIVKTRNEIYSLIGEFKDNISKQYIIPAPNRASAYYALSLSLNGEPLFQPKNNRNDSKCFAAVATSLKLRFPNTKRTQHLCKLAEEAMIATRPKKTRNIEVKEGDITTTGLFDVKLPGIDGDSISLSSLAGKVVLLDFTIYEDAKISSRNINLRKIYNKYHDKGFEIYQISYDAREHFWQQSASNLPWTCVRDGEGAYSSYIKLYNVQRLPTFYLINRENEITLRDVQIENLEKEIEQLLK